MIVEATAPTRVDLAGGTLDIWPVYLMLEDPLTVNLALALRVRARVTLRRDRRVVLSALDRGSVERFPSIATARARARHRLAAEMLAALDPGRGAEVETESGVPPGSGLGGSSALAVALAGALARAGRRRVPAGDLARFASDVEGRVLGVPPGTQDHLASVHGGLNAFRYGPGAVVREPLRADPRALARRLVLAYTGVSHASAANNWRVVRAFLDRDAGVRRGFREVAAAAVEVRAALEAGDLRAAARGMERDSRARRRLFPGFHTARTLELAAAGRRAGALGGRPCGAGGGGCVVFLAPEGGSGRIAAALEARGARVLPVEADLRGLRVRVLGR